MMDFKTTIKIRPSKYKISHNDKILMIGSCFTDNIGERLSHDGFAITHNPMGVLYNPASISNALSRAKNLELYDMEDLICDSNQIYHCLDFNTRYSGSDPLKLLIQINKDIENLHSIVCQANVLIVTLGTAYVYKFNSTGKIVGNCHKLPANLFERSRMNIDECQKYLEKIISLFIEKGKRIIFTVSPIRHLADGFHENQLSKSTLMMALDNALAKNKMTEDLPSTNAIEYFPAFEIMMDDLRDYRFYAADMKHPSDLAIEYIYQNFSDVYFSSETQNLVIIRRKEYLRSQHRPILS